jgi:hypothetical protein
VYLVKPCKPIGNFYSVDGNVDIKWTVSKHRSSEKESILWMSLEWYYTHIRSQSVKRQTEYQRVVVCMCA